MTQILLEPFQLTDQLQLNTRIIMAPMTRNMAHDDLSPTDAMTDYYAKRASAGLIITEGTIIRPDARGYSNVPGIYTSQHIAGWKRVTEAVHDAGGRIFSQIWHVGRVSHPHFLQGELPVAPSATTMSAPVNRSDGLFYGESRALSLQESEDLIESFAQAAKNAIEAGFDGVEIHGANGYLVDQFLHYHTNHRQDQYGDSPENMVRFAQAVVNACGNAIGFERVGIRLSPAAYLNEIVQDPRDASVFQTLLEQLNDVPIAYVHTGNFDDSVEFKELGKQTMTAFIRSHYRGTLMACGGYSIERAEAGIANNEFDLIALGRPFIANPDLIHRLKHAKPLADYETDMLTNLD